MRIGGRLACLCRRLVEAAVRAAVLAEREACAQLAEQFSKGAANDDALRVTCFQVANLIRSRHL